MRVLQNLLWLESTGWLLLKRVSLAGDLEY